MSSIRSNIALNTVNTITSVIFPVITFPYAARVLMPEGIGTISFLNGIISYIVLLTSLGIPLYAVKKIASVRDNEEQRNQATIEILTLGLALCIIGYIIVAILACLVPEIREQSKIFYILSISILFTTIGAEWFYQAIEDFKFVTIRAIIVRTLAASALFMFVKSPGDLIPYSFIIVASTIGNNIINFHHLHKFNIFSSVSIKRLTISGAISHFMPSLMVFSISAISSIYLSLNSIMLGFISTETEVGYYTAASKITQIAIMLVCSVGTVLLPRISNLIATGNEVEYKQISEKSLRLSLILSLPIVAGSIILAAPIISAFCGDDFQPSAIILVYCAPTIYLSSLSSLIGLRILYPNNKLNIVVWSACCGAIANILLNFLLIPEFKALGAAISFSCAELIVLVIQIYSGRKYLPFKISAIFQPRYYIATIIMCAAIIPVLHLLDGIEILSLTVIPIAGALIFTIALIAMHDKFTIEILSGFSRRLLK
ncbi:MAG: oligosaccharide flippase family protein [Paramuribaculum sp.]|nr:oligosaccharide flippase family protein [Paramuribaculum sp.]